MERNNLCKGEQEILQHPLFAEAHAIYHERFAIESEGVLIDGLVSKKASELLRQFVKDNESKIENPKKFITMVGLNKSWAG